MRRNNLITLLSVFCMIFPALVRAEVTLPDIVSSGMVLQRNTTVALWGWAEPGERVTISTSWLDKPLKMKADTQGNWRANVVTTGERSSHSITITGESNEIVLEDVVFGEVWLCSGQSNMQQPLNGYPGQPTIGGHRAIMEAGNPDIRLFSVDREGAKEPLNKFIGFDGWQHAGPENVGGFSAVAYFFGMQLQEILDVPVGLIHTSYGGSSVQAWISKEVMEQFQEVDLDDVDIRKRTNHIPTALFNAMLNPLIPYTIKGALWYQGESNRLEPDAYTELFPAMVKDWRTRWGIGDFPFYYVQIAPYWYNNVKAFDSPENSAFIREAQLKCLDLIPNSGIAITMDIGDKMCIHPPRKKEVADRLLFNALNGTYGFEQLDYASPVYDAHEVKEGGIVLSFTHAETGLYSFGDLEGFEIAGADRVFYPAEAEIVERKFVKVWSHHVSDPVAVRYAWRNWVKGTLFDVNLLPAPSFRTDSWEDATVYTEPLDVLVITGKHEYNRDAFNAMMDHLEGMECTVMEMGDDPGALFESVSGFPYDAIAMYNYRQKLTDSQKRNLLELVKSGVGLTVMHHALAGFPGWIEYENLIGATYVLEEQMRGEKHYPRPTWKHGVDMEIRVEDKNHPITTGVEDFTIHDETYKSWVYHEGNHLLLSTENELSNPQIAWTRTFGDARIFCIQLGHDEHAFQNENYRRLLEQGIAWTAE
jgi:sialate O-acetylesterase